MVRAGVHARDRQGSVRHPRPASANGNAVEAATPVPAAIPEMVAGIRRGRDRQEGSMEKEPARSRNGQQSRPAAGVGRWISDGPSTG